MIYARQSTAIIVTVGPCLDADGVADTGVVVGAFLASKNGAAPAALNGSATLTHRNTGHYSLSLTTSDVDTVGTVEIVINDTTTACPIKEIQVVEPATYDVLFANAAPGPASPTNITAGTVTTATNVTTVNGLAANVITAASIANAAIDAATFAADVDAEFLSYIVDDATKIDASALNTAAVTSIPAILADTGTDGVVVAAASKAGYSLTATTGLGNQTSNITGNLSGSVGSVTGAVGSVTGLTASDVGAIKAKTDNLPSDPADASIVAAATDAILTAVGDVPTNAELTAALDTADDDTLAAIAALHNFDPATDEVLANVKKVNDVTIVGDGSATPFNV
jgi:hypothetical protein